MSVGLMYTQGFAPWGMEVLEVCSEFQEVGRESRMEEAVRFWKLGDTSEPAGSMSFCFWLRRLISASESSSS